MPRIVIEDDGYLDLDFPGGAKARIDLFEANNTYADLCNQHEPETDAKALAEEWIKYLTGAGCPEMSHGTGFRIAADISRAVTEFKKKHGLGSETADSPASTASPSAT